MSTTEAAPAIGGEHQNRMLVTERSLRIKHVEYLLSTVGAVVICALISLYLPSILFNIKQCRHVFYSYVESTVPSEEFEKLP